MDKVECFRCAVLAFYKEIFDDQLLSLLQVICIIVVVQQRQIKYRRENWNFKSATRDENSYVRFSYTKLSVWECKFHSQLPQTLQYGQ